MSTEEKPKQFIDVLGTGRSLLQLTLDRFATVCPPSNVWIVTNKKYQSVVAEQLPEIDPSHILLEPCRRNTAPCIAYVSWRIKKECPGANVIVTPSDHVVTDVQEFRRVVTSCLKFLKRDMATVRPISALIRQETPRCLGSIRSVKNPICSRQQNTSARTITFGTQVFSFGAYTR